MSATKKERERERQNSGRILNQSSIRTQHKISGTIDIKFHLKESQQQRMFT